MPVAIVVKGQKKLRYIVRWKPEWLQTLKYIDRHYMYRKNGNIAGGA